MQEPLPPLPGTKPLDPAARTADGGGMPPTASGMGVSWGRAGARLVLRMLAGLGGYVRTHGREVRHAAAVIGTVGWTAVQPRSWSRPERSAFARQVLAVGIEPLGFVATVAVFVGISVVVQFSFWTGEAGQSQLLGPLLVTVVARELAPVLINLVVIVRSGSAMATELGVMQISGDVRALEAQGGDPFLRLVMPRVLGAALSTFCLTIVFILVALASGFLFAAWMGKGSRDVLLFADTVSSAVRSKDMFSILAKSILPAVYASACCCIGGLGVGDSFLEIPRVTQRALTRSIAGLFVISATVSLLTWL